MNPPRAIAVTGSTGLVGSALVDSLAQDNIRVLRLVRREARTEDEVAWNPTKQTIEAAKLEGIDAVVHLAGRNIVDRRWTPAFKKEIRDSRVLGTQLISKTIAELDQKPRVLVSASAIGYYGVRGSEVLTEESSAGTGFLAETCQEWEAACQPAWEAGVRVVQLRIGAVLSPKGGMLKKLLPQFRLGLGGVVGRGDQIVSWIALHDLVNSIRHAIDHEGLHGAVNATAPEPVSNRTFTKALGAKLSKPTFMMAPAGALRVALGPMASEIIIGGADIRPERLTHSGFQFQEPKITDALDQLLG